MSRSTVSGIENGNSFTSIENYIKIADVLGTTLIYLVSDKHVSEQHEADDLMNKLTAESRRSVERIMRTIIKEMIYIEEHSR